MIDKLPPRPTATCSCCGERYHVWEFSSGRPFSSAIDLGEALAVIGERLVFDPDDAWEGRGYFILENVRAHLYARFRQRQVELAAFGVEIPERPLTALGRRARETA